MGRADGVDSGTTTVLRDLAATFRSFALSLAAAASAFCQAPPIIDVHLHAQPLTAFGPIGIKACQDNVAKTWPPADPRSSSVSPDSLEECPNPIYTAKVRDHQAFAGEVQHHRRTQRAGGLRSSLEIGTWRSRDSRDLCDQARRRRRGSIALPDRKQGRSSDQVIGEALLQYSGLSPADPSFDPYWAKSLGTQQN